MKISSITVEIHIVLWGDINLTCTILESIMLLLEVSQLTNFCSKRTKNVPMIWLIFMLKNESFLIYQIIHLRCISNILKRPFKKFILFLFSRRRPPKTTKTYTRREWSQSFGYGASPSSQITGCNPSTTTTTGKSISRKKLIISFFSSIFYLSVFFSWKWNLLFYVLYNSNINSDEVDPDRD